MTLPVGVIDYGAGNIGSVINMLKYVGTDTVVIQAPKDLDRVRGVVLPGVGHFDSGVRQLRATGLYERLSQWDGTDQPLVGICLGMQLLMSSSEEGVENGLGLIAGRCVRFRPRSTADKVPHMGWNTVTTLRHGSALDRQAVSSRYYFVHSYHAEPVEDAHRLGVTNYLGEFCSAITDGAMVCGYQFHPEKSHRYGIDLMREFANSSC